MRLYRGKFKDLPGRVRFGPSHTLTIFLCILFLSGLPLNCRAENWRETFSNNRTARKTFLAGVRAYETGNYDRAEKQFRTVLPDAGAADREAVSLFVAKCLLAQQLYPDADAWLADCRDEFAEGLYADVFWYLSGHAAYSLNDPTRAAEFYLHAYRKTKDRRLEELTVFSLSPLFGRWLDDTYMRRLADDIPEGPVAAEFYYRWGTRQETRRRFAQAEKSFREVLRQGRGGKRYSAAKERLDVLRDRLKNTTRIGLLYPLTGPLADFGRQMLTAVQLAAETWQREHGGLVEIIMEDTRGEPLIASAAGRRLLEEGVSAVVGPLTSECAIAAGNVLSCEGLLHVLPVASLPGLTSLSENIYQLTPPPPEVGEFLAEYAIDSLGDSVFAILAPDEPYGHEISLAFQKTALQKGALVFPVQFTRPGQTDYGKELMRIKRIILRELYDSTVFFTMDGDTLDEEQVPVYIGGFLLPGDADDLNDIVPQVRFYNIFPRYLGTDGWAYPERLFRTRQYLEGAIFASAEHHAEDDRRWAGFKTAWKKHSGDEPDLIAARTYDAITFALSILGGKEPFSANADGLPVTFHGVSGTIEFTPHRENAHIPLYGHLADKIVPAHLMPPRELPPQRRDTTLIGPVPED